MSLNDVQFGSFGDWRDERRGADQPYSRHEVYQPPGSKNRFALTESGGMVKANRLGKGDQHLPGGRPAKQNAGLLHVWKTNEPTPEILSVGVAKGFRGQGLADAMLRMASDRHPNLSHSGALSPEGSRFAQRNPLPGDTAFTKTTQRKHAVADAATAMLGGPKRRGF